LTKKDDNFSDTLNEAILVATSVAFTKKEIQKLREEFLSLANKDKIVEYVEIKGPAGPRGPIGPVGVAGERGIKGDKGDTGERGEKGDVGPQGNLGQTGPRGLKGDKGDKGEVGPQGIQGERGPQGLKGDKGDDGKNGLDGRDGETGPIGPAGPAGTQGIQGERGPKGDRGDKGEAGRDGQQGIQGPAGPKVDTGPQGVQGPPGKDGKDGDVKPVEEKFKKFQSILENDLQQYKNKINASVSKAMATDAWKATGSGEVNLRYLDDVDRDSIQDGYVLSYSQANNKFEFVEQTGGVGGGTLDTFARQRANSAYAQANTATSIGQSAYNTANSKSYTFSQNTAPLTANTNDFWANTDSATVYYNFGNTSSPVWVEFGPTGISSGNSAGGNTDLTGYAVNTTLNLVWSTANTAYSHSNSATTLAQAAYNTANSKSTFSGSYSDLSNKPDLTVYLTSSSLTPYATTSTTNSIASNVASAWSTANSATTLAQAAYNQANTAPTQLVNGADTLSLDGSNKINLPGGTSYIFSATNNITLAPDNTGNNYLEIINNTGAVLSTDRAFEIRTNADSTDKVWNFSQGGALFFPDATYQTTAFTGTAIDSLARTTANSATTLAQAAYDYANTIVVPSLSGYATESFVTTRGYLTSSNLTPYATTSTTNTIASNVSNAWSTANLAYTQANTGTTLAQSAYDTANSKSTFSGSYNDLSNKPDLTVYLTSANLTPYATTSTTNTISTNVASAWSTANSAYTQANTATTNASTADTKAGNAWSTANSAYSQANLAYSTAMNAYGSAGIVAIQVQEAWDTANGAYAKANTAITTSGGTTTGTITSNNATAFIAGDAAISGVALQIPREGAIRNLYNGDNTMYFDVSIGGSTNGRFRFRSSSSYTELLDISTDGLRAISAYKGKLPWNSAIDTELTVDDYRFRVTNSGGIFPQVISNTGGTKNSAWTAVGAINGSAINQMGSTGVLLPNNSWTNLYNLHGMDASGDTVTVTFQDKGQGRIYRITFMRSDSGTVGYNIIVERIL
jgi:hypothetical protein